MLPLEPCPLLPNPPSIFAQCRSCILIWSVMRLWRGTACSETYSFKAEISITPTCSLLLDMHCVKSCMPWPKKETAWSCTTYWQKLLPCLLAAFFLTQTICNLVCLESRSSSISGNQQKVCTVGSVINRFIVFESLCILQRLWGKRWCDWMQISDSLVAWFPSILLTFWSLCSRVVWWWVGQMTTGSKF